MTSALSVSGVSKRFGDVVALVDASLEVAAGEVVAVLGPSGSGKSTLFRCITRLTEPDAGTVRISGRSLSGLGRSELRCARAGVGLVFQQHNLVRRRSALANVMTGALAALPAWRVASGIYPQEFVCRADEALAAVGLAAQRGQRADTLSGGQQQRVSIARALMQQSSVLLADEPVASLDPESARLVLKLLRDLARTKHLAVLCTLHQPDLARQFADRIIQMQSGRVAPGPRPDTRQLQGEAGAMADG